MTPAVTLRQLNEEVQKKYVRPGMGGGVRALQHEVELSEPVVPRPGATTRRGLP